MFKFGFFLSLFYFCGLGLALSGVFFCVCVNFALYTRTPPVQKLKIPLNKERSHQSGCEGIASLSRKRTSNLKKSKN